MKSKTNTKEKTRTNLNQKYYLIFIIISVIGICSFDNLPFYKIENTFKNKPLSSKVSIPNIEKNVLAEEPQSVNANEIFTAGTIIIPMDNTYQGNPPQGTGFNIRAYGLIVRLLHAGVPLKWAIKSGKSKDATDFTGVTRTAYGSGSGTNRSFKGGPFIVYPGYEAQAKSIIKGWGASNSVVAYELTATKSIPIHSDILHKPYALIVSDGSNYDIHETIFQAAGLTKNTHYEIYSGSNPGGQLTSSSCFTFVSSPHSDINVSAMQNFLASGGNYFAQCAAVRESESYSGGLIMNGSPQEGSSTSGSLTYAHNDYPAMQFIGSIDGSLGGSHESSQIGGFNYKSGASGKNLIYFSGSVKSHGGRYPGLTANDGGYVTYLGSHDHEEASSWSDYYNASRILMNAFMMNVDRPSSCGLTICSDITSTGNISGGATYCAASANPPNISSTQPASGGSGGSILYRWQYRNGTSGNWLTINNATSANYNPSTITQTRQYRRGAKRSCSSSGYIYTNKVTFSFSSNITDPGSISGGESYCTPTNPPNITNAQSATGGSGGSIEYRWRYRNGTSGSWTTISNATSATYNPPTLSQTRQYIRGARRDCTSSNFPFIYGNKVTYTISTNLTDPGRISGGATYCVPTNPPNITNAAPPNGGNVQYRWQYRNGTSGSWTTISNATSSSYNPPTISQTRQYRRGARSSCTSTSLPYVYGNKVTFSFPTITTDTDGDGIPDVCDEDDDNDGIFDSNENICGVLDAVDPTAVNTGGPFNSSTLTTINGQVFTWKTTGVFPSNSVGHFVTGNGRISYKSSNGEPASTAEVFDVEVTFPTPTTTFQIRAWDFDGVHQESIDNFSVQPTQISSNAQNLSGSITSTDPNEDIDLFWNLDGPVSSLTFSVNRPSSGLGIFFSVGFPFCDTDKDGLVDALDPDSDGDGCFDVVESGGIDANNNGILDGSGLNSKGRVTGGSGGYNGATGKEIVAHQLSILNVPSDQIKNSGSTSFTITARGNKATNYNNGIPIYGASGNADNGVNYQWYDGTPGSGGIRINNGGIYSGVTTNTLNISDVAGLNGTQYCVVVTHNDNVCSEEIRCATLTVDTDEICNDGQDNDGDGLVDCADLDCSPVIISVTPTDMTCPLGTNNGKIVITAIGSGTLTYSINNEPNYQASNTFDNLGQGQYTIRVKSSTGCETIYDASVIVLSTPNCPNTNCDDIQTATNIADTGND